MSIELTHRMFKGAQNYMKIYIPEQCFTEVEKAGMDNLGGR